MSVKMPLLFRDTEKWQLHEIWQKCFLVKNKTHLDKQK